MMLQTVVLIQTITSLVQLHVTKGMTLDEGAQQTCGEDTKVSAILEDVNDPNLVHLFSGDIVWKMKLSDFTLQEVHEIRELFEGASGVIEAAAYSPRWKGYMLARVRPLCLHNVLNMQMKNFQKDDLFNYSLITGFSLNMKKEKLFDALKALYHIGRIEELFNCATVHADLEKGVHHMITVDFKGIALNCFVNADGTEGDVKHPCVGTKVKDYGIPNPAGVPASEFKGTTCEGMFIRFVNTNNVTWEFLYADKEKLRLWHDEKLNQSVNLNELFGCYSPWTAIILVGVVVTVAVVVTVTAVVIVFVVQGPSGFDDERLTSLKMSKQSSKHTPQK